MDIPQFSMLRKIHTLEVSKYLLPLLALLTLTPNIAFGFYGNDKVVIDQILLEQELQEQKLDYIHNNETIEGQGIMNLLSAVEIKKEVADEKESAYEKAINELKWWVAGIGAVMILILTGLGLWHNNELKTKKDELQLEFDKSIKLMEKANELDVKRVLIDLKQENEEHLKLMRLDINKQLAAVTIAVNHGRKTETIVLDSESEFEERDIEPTFD